MCSQVATIFFESACYLPDIARQAACLVKFRKARDWVFCLTPAQLPKFRKEHPGIINLSCCPRTAIQTRRTEGIRRRIDSSLEDQQTVKHNASSHENLKGSGSVASIRVDSFWGWVLLPRPCEYTITTLLSVATARDKTAEQP